MWKKDYCYLFEHLCEFSEISKKTLYVVAVKGSNKALLCGVEAVWCVGSGVIF